MSTRHRVLSMSYPTSIPPPVFNLSSYSPLTTPTYTTPTTTATTMSTAISTTACTIHSSSPASSSSSAHTPIARTTHTSNHQRLSPLHHRRSIDLLYTKYPSNLSAMITSSSSSSSCMAIMMYSDCCCMPLLSQIPQLQSLSSHNDGLCYHRRSISSKISWSRPPPEASPASPNFNPSWWQSRPEFQQHKSVNRQSHKVGPYKRGRLFVSPRDDPQTFVGSCLIVGLTLYAILTMTPGESYKSRRNRVVRQRLYKEYGLTEADVDEIEGCEPLLSDELRQGGGASHDRDSNNSFCTHE
eukprot:GHVQ01036095.1.p1 GENE.GHVQ01036095.1~~GHVQ01036095.1.p1  ORF type:complete len:298 (+),score=66.22 GHVQ01036095.1:54-947(+)